MPLDCETEIHLNTNFRAGYEQTQVPANEVLLSATSWLGLCSDGGMLSWHRFMSILSQQPGDKHDHWQLQYTGSSLTLCTLIRLMCTTTLMNRAELSSNELLGDK